MPSGRLWIFGDTIFLIWEHYSYLFTKSPEKLLVLVGPRT